MGGRFRSFLWLVYLLGLGLASVLLADLSWKSVTNYETKYAFHADLPGGAPLTKRVVLIVLDGIRFDVSRRMKALQDLARRGSSGTARVGVPSLSNPGRAVLATGAWPEINGVTNNGHFQPPPVDSIFSLAERAGVPRAVAGSDFWRRAFGDYLDGHMIAREKAPRNVGGISELAAWQQRTCARFAQFLGEYPAGILVTEVTAADAAGHDFGGESQPYLEVAKAVDECVASLVAALDDGATTFVVTSDHGHIQRRGRGGHGGQEDEVLEVPLVLAGKGIRKSSGWRAEAVDVAPAICALLGLPLPATSQGGILWQVLDAPSDIERPLRDREAQQRELATSRLPDRAEGLAAERRQHTLPAAGAFALFTIVGGWALVTQRTLRLPLLRATVIYYAAYYGLFAALGLGYSLSAIGREEYLISFLLRDFISAAAAMILASLALGRWTSGAFSSLILRLALLVTSTLGFQVTAVYFWSGLLMTGFMPDLWASFKAYLDLVAIAAVASTGVALCLANLGLEHWRARSPSLKDKVPARVL